MEGLKGSSFPLQENTSSIFTFLMERFGRDLSELSLDAVRDDELLYYVDKVLSSDDLFKLILLEMPVVSLVLFKLVSNRWSKLIRDDTFIRDRSQIPRIDPPSGLFISDGHGTREYAFWSFDTRIRSRLRHTFEIMEGNDACNINVMQSCNGLFLCSVFKPGKMPYCIYNPTTNKYKILPNPLDYEPEHREFILMDFDPTKSPHYKVVHAASIGDDFPAELYRIQTYSSETGIWNMVCDLSKPFIGLRSGVYCNDAIHWINSVDNAELHYKLEFVNNTVVLTKMQLPETLETRCKLFVSRGCLLLIGKNKTQYNQMDVYEMGNGDSEWSLKYFVDFTEYPRQVACIDLGEREEDSFMLVSSGTTAWLCKFFTKTIRMIRALRPMLVKSRYSSLECFLFTASFASV